MSAIFLREIRAYFKAPLGYVFVGATCLFAGLYFYAYNLFGGAASLDSLFSALFSVELFLIPILTMRLLSEERRQKTDQLLLTSPVSGMGIILGKYPAAMAVFALAAGVTLLDAAVLDAFARVNWKLTLGSYAGLVLFGAALVAICLFLSSLTESQLIAAVSGFSVSLLVILLDTLAPILDNAVLKALCGYLNFASRYAPFTYGVFALENVIFCLSIAGLFLYLTTARMERRRWS